MLDGLLGTGFKAKCKSEIKSTKARIELVRRRAEAKQRFLKDDLAKLILNGLDVDAFSRTEEYLALQNVLASYDFIQYTCEYITGQLSCMQKQRECPEECREAVGSLMFAAARFSDLPELRDLRNLLQQRYGNSLECYVNQKFLEKLSSRPPERERKIKLLKDIASEYSLTWDVKGFEQRIAPPSAIAQFQSQASKYGSNHVVAKDYNQLSKNDASAVPNRHEYPTTEKRTERGSGADKMCRSAEETFYTREDRIPEPPKQDIFGQRQMHVLDGERKNSEREGFKREFSTPETDRRDATKQRPELVKGVEYSRRKKPDIHNPNDVTEARPEILNNEGRSQPVKKDSEAADKFRPNHAELDTFQRTLRSHKSHDTERVEKVDSERVFQNSGVNDIGEGNVGITPFQGRSPVERKDAPSGPNYRSERDVEKFRTNVLEENSLPAPPYSRSKNSMLPPPYTKPRDGKHRSNGGSRLENSEYNVPSSEPLSHNRDQEKIQKETDKSRQEKERTERLPPKTHYPEDLEHDHNGMIPLSKPRSVRRKHRRSSSHLNEIIGSEDPIAIRRSSSSRRKEHSRKGIQILVDNEREQSRKGIQILVDDEREHSRKGIQILVDDEKPKDDKEEKIIDKMLLHYSKKSSQYDIEKLRPKSQAAPTEKITVHAGESSHDQRRRVHNEKSEHSPVPTRSFSLPPKHTAPEKNIKSFTRVNSLQPDDQARHVHPNLPDYDDFVARLAALRG